MKKMMTGVLALVMVLVMVGCGQKDNGVGKRRGQGRRHHR